MFEESKNNPFHARGLRFSCICCSACCRHETGYVFLSELDVSLLAKELNMNNKTFVTTYCRWVPSLHGNSNLSLKEKSNYDCIFWDEELRNSTGGCRVYEARPLQCRAFPFWSSVIQSKNSWKAQGLGCPGINRGTLHSRETIEKWLAQRQNEPIIVDQGE